MLTPPEDARPGWPPELLNNDPRGFAWGVWRDRTPKLVTQVRDARPYGPAQRHALDDLLAEICSGVIRPLGSHAHDQETWSSWGAGYFGMPWLDAPFLWSESYFYRRLLDAIGFFEPGPWRWVDPFEDLKAAELADPGLEPDLAALDDLQRLPADERGAAKLLASLWGNRADLGFRIGRSPESREQGSSRLVADDSADFWAALGPDASVVIVADNAGRELLADLVGDRTGDPGRARGRGVSPGHPDLPPVPIGRLARRYPRGFWGRNPRNCTPARTGAAPRPCTRAGAGNYAAC